MRILIVDDDAWAEDLTGVLTRRGHKVHLFADPMKACTFVKDIARCGFLTAEDMPEAVILEYLLPQLTGFQVLERISALLKPDCRILFVTRRIEQLRNAKLQAMGIAGCIKKPADMDIVVGLVEGATGDQHLIARSEAKKHVSWGWIH